MSSSRARNNPLDRIDGFELDQVSIVDLTYALDAGIGQKLASAKGGHDAKRYREDVGRGGAAGPADTIHIDPAPVIRHLPCRIASGFNMSNAGEGPLDLFDYNELMSRRQYPSRNELAPGTLIGRDRYAHIPGHDRTSDLLWLSSLAEQEFGLRQTNCRFIVAFGGGISSLLSSAHAALQTTSGAGYKRPGEVTPEKNLRSTDRVSQAQTVGGGR